MDRAERPLSPHVFIYRWQITNTLSILHRATGVALSIGLLVLTWWLVSLASGPENYAATQDVLSAAWFRLPLIGWIFCFFYHFGNGIRHLFWDAGYGFEHHQIRLSGWLVVAFAIVATLIFSLIAVF